MLSLQESYKERLALHFATNASMEHQGATIPPRFGFQFCCDVTKEKSDFSLFTKDRLKQLLFLSHFFFHFLQGFLQFE